MGGPGESGIPEANDGGIGARCCSMWAELGILGALGLVQEGLDPVKRHLGLHDVREHVRELVQGCTQEVEERQGRECHGGGQWPAENHRVAVEGHQAHSRRGDHPHEGGQDPGDAPATQAGQLALPDAQDVVLELPLPGEELDDADALEGLVQLLDPGVRHLQHLALVPAEPHAQVVVHGQEEDDGQRAHEGRPAHQLVEQVHRERRHHHRVHEVVQVPAHAGHLERIHGHEVDDGSRVS